MYDLDERFEVEADELEQSYEEGEISLEEYEYEMRQLKHEYELARLEQLNNHRFGG